MTQASIQGKFAYGWEYQETGGISPLPTTFTFANHASAGNTKGYTLAVKVANKTYRYSNSPLGDLYYGAPARNDYYEGTNHNNLRTMLNTGKFSVELLVNNVNAGIYQFFSSISQGVVEGCSIRQATGKILFQLNESAGTSHTLTDGTGGGTGWTHIVCVVDKDTQEWKNYRDGSESASASWTYGAVQSFGSYHTQNYVAQDVRFIRYYNAALTSTEVTDLYNSAAYRNAYYVNANYQAAQTGILIGGTGSTTGSMVKVEI